MKNIISNLTLQISVAFFSIFCLSGVSNAEMITLYAAEDSGILDKDDRNDPYPGIIYSELDTLTSGNIWLSFLKFDLSPLAGKTIYSAELELTSHFNHSNEFFNHEVFSSSDDSWTEEIVTGINRPLDTTLTLLDSTRINGISQSYSWNVTMGVSGADGLAGTNNLITFLVRPELSQAGNAFGPHFNDRNNFSGVPRLIINASSSECSAIGTISENIDIYIPSINYQTSNEAYKIGAELEYLGTNSEGKPIWGLRNFGFNPPDCSSKGTLSANIDIFIPTIHYQTSNETYNIWINLEYLGTDSEGKHIWSLQDIGLN